MATKNTGKATAKNVKAEGKGKAKKRILTQAGTAPVHNRTLGVGGNLFTGSLTTVKVPTDTAKAVKRLKKDAIGETGASKCANGQVRISWRGHKLSPLLRWMGYNGANVATAAAWLEALGFPGVHLTTITAQVTSGRVGKSDPKAHASKGGYKGYLPGEGDIPPLSSEEVKLLNSLRPDDAE